MVRGARAPTVVIHRKQWEAFPHTVSQDELLWPTSACPAVAPDYCTRGLAAQAHVPHTQVTSPFVTPVCTGGTSQHLAKGPLPS